MTMPADITETANRIANKYHDQIPGRRERSLADVVADALLAERERAAAQLKQPET
jgi:hypothetical protein